MNVIPCQGKDCATEGCSACGGSGVAFQELACNCGRAYWSRSGVHTIYHGKKWISLDGAQLIYQIKNGFPVVNCDRCHE